MKANSLKSLTPERIRDASIEDLRGLGEEIREFLMASVSRTGGHIGANLGTVDLTLALHHVFQSPIDRLVWDTGHQGYTHKIVTGRAEMFPTLNSFGGMNRFLTRAESEHDPIEASHAGTSISVGLGMALARELEGTDGRVVAVIGDGSLVEGMALEALNHASAEDTGLIVVLNDNGFAISPGFGAVHEYLQKQRVKGEDENPEALFTALGYEYVGPVDGHDIEALVNALRRAKGAGRVPFVHVKTVKGHGFRVTEDHPLGMHFSFPFDLETGEALEEKSHVDYQDVAAKVILEEMERDRKIVAITPSTLYATGLQPAFDRFPERCFDPGMEEQHAMTLTVGFGLEGYKPVVFYQSTFMQRAFDQLVHDVAFTNLPTLILTVRTGFAGYDNPTHHGIYDFAYLRGIPNLRVLYPKDRFELARMVREELRDLDGPTIIGMPYGPVHEYDDGVLEESVDSLRRPQRVREGDDALVIAVGHQFGPARDAIERLAETGMECGLVNLRALKPLPERELLEWAAEVDRVITVEQGVLDGGVGSAIGSMILDHDLRCEMLRIGIPCKFVEPGDTPELLEIYGLDGKGIAAKIRDRWPGL